LHNKYVNGHGQVAVLGIDLGTSGVKALVAGADGEVLGRGVAGYPVRVPAPGRAESAPEDWWLATRAAVRDALAEADHATVTAMAVAGQMHGVVLADERGAPLRPAILWLDQRAAAEAATYAELPCEYTAVLGNRPAPGMAGPLLSWLLTHEPGTVRAAWWALQPKDWLRLRLVGQAATDPTDASGTLLFDLARNAWADPLIEKLGLPREKLAPVRDSASLAGPLLAGPAADLGLRQGIPVAVGAGDTAAALFAAGLRADEAMPNLGSGGQWVVLEDEFRPADTTNLYRAVGGGYYRLAPAPNPAATGAWTGLTLAHEREDVMRSALDGVAGLLRQRVDDLRAADHAPKRVILGGAGNPACRALLAQTLDLPLHDAPASWLTPAGAARLAAEVQ
jgi:xylulokinase